MDYKSLYDLVCSNIESATGKSFDATQALYNYTLDLDDVEIWSPRDAIYVRERKWAQVVGSYFKPNKVDHRSHLCYVLSKRIAKQIESEKKRENNNSASYDDLSEEIILHIAEMIAKSNLNSLKRVANVNKTWNRIVAEVQTGIIIKFTVNFFTNLIYHKPLYNDIAIYSEDRFLRMKASGTLKLSDKEKHDSKFPLIYISQGSIIYNDGIEESRSFLKQTQDNMGFNLVQYYDGSDSEMDRPVLGNKVTKRQGDVRIPFVVTDRQVWNSPRLSNNEAVFLTDPNSLIKSILLNSDENLIFVIPMNFMYSDTYAFSKALKNVEVIDDVMNRLMQYSNGFSAEYSRNPTLVDNFPAELAELHGIKENRKHGGVSFTEALIAVDLNVVNKYIKRHLAKVGNNPWFTTSTLEQILRGQNTGTEGIYNYIVADEEFLQEFLKDCKKRKLVYIASQWKVPSLVQEQGQEEEKEEEYNGPMD